MSRSRSCFVSAIMTRSVECADDVELALQVELASLLSLSLSLSLLLFYRCHLVFVLYIDLDPSPTLSNHLKRSPHSSVSKSTHQQQRTSPVISSFFYQDCERTMGFGFAWNE